MTALLPNLAESRGRDARAAYNAEAVTFVEDTATLAARFPAAEAGLAPSAAPPASGLDRTLAAPAAVSETYGEAEEETVDQRA